MATPGCFHHRNSVYWLEFESTFSVEKPPHKALHFTIIVGLIKSALLLMRDALLWSLFWRYLDEFVERVWCNRTRSFWQFHFSLPSPCSLANLGQWMVIGLVEICTQTLLLPAESIFGQLACAPDRVTSTLCHCFTRHWHSIGHSFCFCGFLLIDIFCSVQPC